MAVNGFNMQEASNILKVDYLPVVREQIPLRTPLFDRLRKGTEDVVGSNARIALHIGRNQGVGSRSDTDPTLPVPGNQKYKTMDVATKNIYGTLTIQGKVFRAAKTDRGAFINAVDAEMKGMTEAFQWELNRQLFSTSIGALGVIGTGTASATQTVTASDASYATRWIVPDMLVDVYDATGVTKRNGSALKVVSVNKTTGAVVLSGTVTSSNGDIIVRTGSAKNEITGLVEVFTNNTTIYGAGGSGGIDRSANPWFNTLNFASGGTLKETEVQQVLDEVEINTNGGNVSLMISDHATRRIYQQLLVSLKRFTEPTKLKGGWTALDYNGIPWVVDPDCGKQRIYFLDESTWKIHTMIGELFTWGEEDNQVLRQISGSDAYEAFMVSYLELVCDTPAKNAVLTGVVG